MKIHELKDLLKNLVGDLEKKYPYASAFAGSKKGRQVSVTTSEKSVSFIPPSKGVTFSVFNGHHFYERSTNHLTENEIKETAGKLFSECPAVAEPEIIIDPGPAMEEDFKVSMEIDPFSVALEDIIDNTRMVKDKLAELSSKVVYGLCRTGNEQVRELFVNRTKTLFQELNRWDLVYFAVLKDGPDSCHIFDGNAIQGGYDKMRINEEDLRKMVSDGEKILHSGRIKPGYYDCIFAPGMSGMFAHESFGHGMETDMYLKKRARGQEYMGHQVAAPIVNIFDSPAYPDQAGSFSFDHEGQPAADTQIIRDGILVSGLTDLNSAARLGYARTPNGRRENYAHKAYARMTNTYFAPGNAELEEMVESIEYGFLVDYSTSGMEDPKGWGIQLEALYAREIKNGVFTDNYFTPVIVTGYVPELLNSISMIGKDIEMHGTGYCGKGRKEYVKVSTGGPHMRLKARLA